MPLPEGFDATRDSPNPGLCRRCRQGGLKPTKAFKVTTTGIVEQLCLCLVCLWGTTIRYVPLNPAQYLVVNYISPGTKRGWAPVPAKQKATRTDFQTTDG